MQLIKRSFDNIKNAISNIIVCIKNIIIDIKKNINNFIIWVFLTAIAIGGVTYFVNIPIEYDIDAMIEYKEYIVNKRSLKIHIVECPSVNKMSENNKLFLNNSLENLIEDGYHISIDVKQE